MNQLLKILLVAFMVSLIGCSNTIEPTDTMNGVENSASISKGNVDNDTFFSQDDDDDSCGEGKERQLSSISFEKMIDCLGLSESQKAALNALKIDNNKSYKSIFRTPAKEYVCTGVEVESIKMICCWNKEYLLP